LPQFIIVALIVLIIAKMVSRNSPNPNTRNEAKKVADHILYGRIGKQAAHQLWGCFGVIFLVTAFLFGFIILGTVL
jgi:hypothetical protein